MYKRLKNILEKLKYMKQNENNIYQACDHIGFTYLHGRDLIGFYKYSIYVVTRQSIIMTITVSKETT